MSTPIAPQVLSVLVKVFPQRAEQQEVIQLLQTECGNNLPLCENETETTPLLRRIRYAALKVSEGDITKLRRAIQVAKSDWRDLLVGAGFANDLNASDAWAKQVLETEN